MPSEPSNQSDQLADVLLHILRRYPDGLSEYELFAELDSAGYTDYGKNSFIDQHKLFCRHFLLFNALYQLADSLHAKADAQLQISPLSIRLLPYQPGQAGLDRHDPLRAFYLDLRELEKLGADDIRQMLGAFWAGYHRFAGRNAALEVLGLSDPVSDETIRQRYRQLAMQLHPDRGGNTRRFQDLAAAMRLLTG